MAHQRCPGVENLYHQVASLDDTPQLAPEEGIFLVG